MSVFNILLGIMVITSSLALAARGQLSDDQFYQATCPSLQAMVRATMTKAVKKEPRMGASILRLFFHDCFVNGCDGSVLLDDTPIFTGEKNVIANRNSARGFEVIDDIKSAVEAKCKATVSCADILAIAARDSVVLLSGPTWKMQLGRRDARTASQSAADSDLPPPFADLSTLISMFAAKGLSAQEMTVLSGGHTIGQAHCQAFRNHVYNESNIDTKFAKLRQTTCPLSGGDTNLAPFGESQNRFDNAFFKDLVAKKGLLHSDQELFNGGSQDALVKKYSKDKEAFAKDFAMAMIKLGNVSPLTGTDGEVRLNCRVIN